MHEVLARTRDAMGAGDERVVATQAAELQLVQNLKCLRAPAAEFKAQPA